MIDGLLRRLIGGLQAPVPLDLDSRLSKLEEDIAVLMAKSKIQATHNRTTKREIKDLSARMGEWVDTKVNL